MRDRLAAALGFNRCASDDHERILADMGRLLRIAHEDPTLDDWALFNRLVEGGVDRMLAWRLVTFVPIAFGRAVLVEFGIEAPSTYLSRDKKGGSSRRELGEEAVFRAATDHMPDYLGRPGFKELAGRGAEVASLSRLLASGSDPKDARFTETITWESPD